MGVSEARQLRQLEDENRQLKQMVTDQALDKWAYKNQVVLDFIRPGKPGDNCYIESFNSRFRIECLNSHYFDSISEAWMRVENWRQKALQFIR